MQKIADLVEKYLQRLDAIEQTYMQDGTFVCSSDVTEEELAATEREYYVLLDVVKSLNNILSEASKH